MAATVIIPTTLRMFTGHNSELELDGGTVGEVITALADEYPETKKVLFGEDGKLREFINVFVGADNIRDLKGYDTTVKDGDEIFGNQVRVKVVKNKVAPPFRKAEFEIIFGEGISKIGEIVDLGVEHNIIKKSGSWFSYGETKLGQGRDAVKTMLNDNPELCEELEAKIMKAITDK